jgi:hypothetical protein
MIEPAALQLFDCPFAVGIRLVSTMAEQSPRDFADAVWKDTRHDCTASAASTRSSSIVRVMGPPR